MIIKNIITKIKSVICLLNFRAILKNVAKSAIEEFKDELLDALAQSKKAQNRAGQ